MVAIHITGAFCIAISAGWLVWRDLWWLSSDLWWLSSGTATAASTAHCRSGEIIIAEIALTPCWISRIIRTMVTIHIASAACVIIRTSTLRIWHNCWHDCWHNCWRNWVYASTTTTAGTAHGRCCKVFITEISHAPVRIGSVIITMVTIHVTGAACVAVSALWLLS